MKLRIAILVLTLILALAGQAAFAVEDCVTGCWTYEPCDGHCEYTGEWEGCGDLWALIQVCVPNDPGAQQALGSSSVDPAATLAGTSPRPSWHPGGQAPAALSPACWVSPAALR